jgi:hypothetical protein
MRAVLTTLGVGFLLVVPWLASTPAAAASGGSVTGDGTGLLVIPPFTGDPVRVQISAAESGGGAVRGHFDIFHTRPSGELEGHVAGEVTCLHISGPMATLTGVVTQGVTPVKPGFDPVGHVVALTVVHGGGIDQVGLDLDWFPIPHNVGACAAAPPQVHVSEGGFVVQGQNDRSSGRDGDRADVASWK